MVARLMNRFYLENKIMNLIKLAALAVFIPGISFAQSGSFAPVLGTDEMGISNGDTFEMLGKANRSYLCGLEIGSDVNSSLVTNIISPSGANITGSLPVSETEAIRYGSFFGIDVRGDTNFRNNLVFFTAPNGSTETGKYTLTVSISSGTPSSYNLRCIETSVTCGFNTFVNDFNFLEVTSVGYVSGVADVTTVDFDGVKNTTSSANFAANSRVDIDIHSLAGPSKFGTIFIQPKNFVPIYDAFTNPKVSFYKNGALTSSVGCDTDAIGFIDN
jgi:hypothetical protein